MRNYLFFALLAVALIGCTIPGPEQRIIPGEDIVTIAQGTQYHGSGLRIGVVSVKEDSATLSIIVEAAEPSEAQAPNFVTITLAVGEETNADGYTIKNLRTETGIGGFMPGQSSGSVTLRITADKTASPQG